MSIFNIRVYGLLINDNNEVLVTDEFRFGKEMTKFPGGGLQWGEGTLDCLKREFKEELGCEIEILKHFYTTDFFQLSAFHHDQQIISIYYLVKTKNSSPTPALPIGEGDKRQQAFPDGEDSRLPGGQVGGASSQSFRWISIAEINENDFTFPIDKKVAGMLRNHKF